jgi:hypothetical protein
LSLGIDLQARPGVVVPGAIGHVEPPLPPKSEITASEIDNVDRLAHLFLNVVRRKLVHMWLLPIDRPVND